MAEKYRFTEKEYWEIYKKVPRLSVEIIVVSDTGVLLTLRDIEPCKGLWHLPGGTVYFAETLLEAVSRVAKKEINIDVKSAKLLGYIEYPSHFKNGLDSPVGIAFEITEFSGTPKSRAEAREIGWFKQQPTNIHPDQWDFLMDHYKLLKD